MADTPRPRARWHRRARTALRHSLRLRLVALFLLLALAMTVIFIAGMQRALSVGWRDAARPLVADYVDRLMAEIGSPPDIAKAQALAQRLPIGIQISGPVVNWSTEAARPAWRGRFGDGDGPAESLLRHTTADGHRIVLGIRMSEWHSKPRRVGWMTLAALLLLTALAYAYVHRLLRPLQDIRAGAQRFGGGDFAQPIAVRRHDELGELSGDINAMAQDLHQMLEAKRALLLAISHELRSPLTRARLHTELLPDQAELASSKAALLRDLGEMRDLVTDLLESERLATRHAALQLEPTDLAALAHEVIEGLATQESGAPLPVLHAAPGLPQPMLDRTRMRLLLRNLLGNALRHSAGAALAPELHLEQAQGGITLRVRDHGPGVDDAVLPHLAEPFYRPDASRERGSGGVGLGLYLCKLVAQAHGARWRVRNAHPGLEVRVDLPAP
ncbi:HAMP domain-containing sensor histidine kinase [Pseudorhodoferax sp. Leaf267]|uniref:HAMP domain-containing sensor histidine kinase n=1 Tax=Pseudorhodoferax sp. Leaf267 TaxID=1736316 RepID=UPI0006F30BF1|nr:HAMP domain-containing sensor histidine kinase [Pseudorhodoferax sp. Leaf267]KQP18199.1 histidine kinase [Pseudorhodoferax sp. Leaf267]